MRLIEQYIAKSIIKIFLSSIVVFCLLYILIDAASNLDELIGRKVSFPVLLSYYASFLPVIVIQTSPIACLIAVLLTYSHLHHHNEIIALRSNGLNFWRITKPAICLGLIVSTIIFCINERFVPQASSSSQQIKTENMILEADSQKKKHSKIKNLTFYGLKNRLVFIDSFDPNTYDLNGITIIGHDENQNIKEKIVALEGKWTGIAWRFYNCQISTYDNQTTPPAASPRGEPTEDIKFYPDKLMDIKETPQDFLKQRLNVVAMNARQLHQYIQRFAGSGATKAINSLRVDFHEKLAYPFVNLVILFVGLPLTMTAGRRKAVTFTSLGLAVALGFLFYVLNAVGLALGKGGWFPPILSAWLAHLVFFGVAFYLIKTKF